MQKPIEGAIAIGVFSGQWHVGKTTSAYLERIRNRMQKTVEGLLMQRFGALYKGAIDCHEHKSPVNSDYIKGAIRRKSHNTA